MPYSGLKGNYQSLKPVISSQFGASDSLGVNFTPLNDFRGHAFTMEHLDFPAQFLNFRHAARRWDVRVYAQEKTTYVSYSLLRCLWLSLVSV